MRRRPVRRRNLLALGALPLAARRRWCNAAAPLQFPRDHGFIRTPMRTEWWYATGWLALGEAEASALRVPAHLLPLAHRHRPEPPEPSPPRQLVFAHTALTDLAAKRAPATTSASSAGFGVAQAVEDDAPRAARLALGARTAA